MHLAAKKIYNTFTIKIYNTFTNKIYNTFTNIHSSTTIFNYSDFNNIHSEILEPTNNNNNNNNGFQFLSDINTQ